MAKGIKYTEGVLARNTTTSGSGVVFFYNIHPARPVVVKTDVLKVVKRSGSFGKWDADSMKREWTAEQFEETYGFLPRTGKTEEMFVQL